MLYISLPVMNRLSLLFPLFRGVGRFRILGGQGLEYWGGQGVGRFRILGGQGLEYWGGQGGGDKFPAGT